MLFREALLGVPCTENKKKESLDAMHVLHTYPIPEMFDVSARSRTFQGNPEHALSVAHNPRLLSRSVSSRMFSAQPENGGVFTHPHFFTPHVQSST